MLYGGLVRFDVQDGVLVLELEPAAAAVLELPALVELAVDDASACVLGEHLPRVVAPAA